MDKGIIKKNTKTKIFFVLKEWGKKSFFS